MIIKKLLETRAIVMLLVGTNLLRLLYELIMINGYRLLCLKRRSGSTIAIERASKDLFMVKSSTLS